ncbi:MAG: sporulation protein YabP [Defluviitaleaceae bacterium]|nr:sporulation protein YabP [Defluviitaleaceae bacterium]
MEEKRYLSKHKVIIEKRQKALITGVIEVMSFDDEEIATETEMGTLIIRGSNLHVNSLNIEKGELEIDGQVDSFNYEDNSVKSKSNILGKIFR